MAPISPKTALAAAAIDLARAPRGHLPGLDALRGLAILSVTLYRFLDGAGLPQASAGVSLPLVDVGARGVDLFFVLSGFLITGILCDTRAAPHYFRDFYVRRSLRIFPLYYTVLALISLLTPRLDGAIAAAFVPARENAAWLWLYGTNVLLAERGAWMLGPVNHFWSLAVEEHFYLVWPLVIYLLRPRTALSLCAALIVGLAAGRVAWLAAGGNDVAAETFTLFRLDGIALGSLLALVAREPGGWRKLVAWAPWVGGVSLVAALGLRLAGKRLFFLPDLVWACVAGALLVQLVSAPAASGWGRVAHSRLLAFFGKYSYGMYVFQNLLIVLLADWITAPGLAKACGGPWAGQLVYCGLMFIATTALAWLSWHGFEKHFLGWREVLAPRDVGAAR